MSQGLGRPEKRKKDGGTGQLVEQSEHPHLLIKLAILYGHGSQHLKAITIVTSKITDHHNKYTNIIMMKKSEIL